MDEELSPFERKLLEKEKSLATVKVAEEVPVAADFEDAVPDIEVGELSPEELAIDQAIKTLPFADAYRKWCGKMQPKGRGKEIKISCPNPQHPDKNPSAWFNTQTNLYHCGGCAMGGDVWDLAAWHFGYPVPNYKRDKTMFRELREKIAVDLGFSITKGLTQTFVTLPGQRTSEEDDDAGDDAQTPTSNVMVLPTPLNLEEAKATSGSVDYPTIEWRSIVPAGTFLEAWMLATTQDTCPEEFHFWTGLMAIGTAVGLNRQLKHNPHVKANLFVSLLGPSGTGKSRAKRHLKTIIHTVMPFDYDNPAFDTGTKVKDGLGSAEFVHHTFTNAVDDPSRPGSKIHMPVRALIDYDEMASIIALANRQGNPLKEMIQGIYDCPDRLETGSLKSGDRIADRPFGQLLSSTQNASLNGIFSGRDDASGFMNRWVFAGGRPKAPDPFGGAHVEYTLPAGKLKEIWIEASKGQVILEWDDQVRPMWEEFFLMTLLPMKEASERRGTFMLQRLDLLMMKLCLLFACNMHQQSITVEAFKQAEAMLPYLLKTYGVLAADMNKTEGGEQVDLIIEGIRELTAAKGKAPNTSEVYWAVGRQRKVFGKLSSPQFRELMKSLSDMGVISEVVTSKPGTRGRPSTGWLVI